MAFSINDLASELGIDVATLKPEAVSKWNGYLTEADTKYTSATRAQQAAQEALDAAARDQQAIDEQIQKFGVTESRLSELESANAALQAALGKVKESGLNIDLSGIPMPKPAEAPDPTKILEQRLNTGFSNMAAALRAQSRFQAVFGKPFTDDPVKLVDEAIAARMPVEQYAEQKYKFASEEQRLQKEASEKHDAEIAASAVKKFQEEHPTLPDRRGRASEFPKIYQPRNASDERSFRSLPVKERIAQSVARAREGVRSQAA